MKISPVKTADVAIVGGGIVGLAVARRLQQAHPDARITLFEKEETVAQHQTGRNSGVIHAGIYYAPGSLKARFCREGVRATEEYCDAHDIPYSRCGKMIVATDDVEAERLKALGARAQANELTVEDVDAAALRAAEPNISGVAGLYSPRTGIVDYAEIARSLARTVKTAGGKIHTGVRVRAVRETGAHLEISVGRETIQADRAIICGGLNSDRLIAASGHSPDFRIVPFRGEYFRLRNQPDDLINHLIYPVPDPERPFLGVHLTRKMDGGFTVGPNAVMALGREAYGRQFAPRDLWDSVSFLGFWKMLAANLGPAISETTASLSRRLYLKRVRRYCPRISLKDFTPYRPGIRAQAVGLDGSLIDDFHFFRTERCLFVGNAPSPAATAAFPIAEHILGKEMQLL